MNRYLPRLAILIAFLAPLGCGGKSGTSTVTGKVVVAGKGPLPGGTIRFVPAAAPDKPIVGIIEADGSYTAPGVPLGECKVTIDNSSLNARRASPPPGSTSMAGMTAGKYIAIDPKLARPETSGLTTKIDGRSFHYDVEVH